MFSLMHVAREDGKTMCGRKVGRNVRTFPVEMLNNCPESSCIKCWKAGNEKASK